MHTYNIIIFSPIQHRVTHIHPSIPPSIHLTAPPSSCSSPPLLSQPSMNHICLEILGSITVCWSPDILHWKPINGRII